MRRLLQHVEQSIRDRPLLSRDQKLLVAVSGGVDSMVLLHVLHGLAAKQGWQLTIAHFNHQLRGRQSDADERLVRLAAKRLGLRLVRGGADVRQHARARKHSLEMAGRELRHKFLARTARQLGIPTVALAHHADDQVELFFLRLLRGAGGEGLQGMKGRSPSPVDGRIELVRPLLSLTKAELQAYARQEGIPFREDASNTLLELARNRIRHELLPLLRQRYQPALARTIPRLMKIVGMESEFVGETARRWLSRKKRGTLQRLPVAVQRQCVHLQLRSLGVDGDFDLVERLRLKPDSLVKLNQRMAVHRDRRGQVHLARIRRPVSAFSGFDKLSVMLDLRGRAGEVPFGSLCLRWVKSPERGIVFGRKVAGTEYFDADKVGSRVVLRHWLPGDRFQPIGMGTTVKMQDLFTNLKIPREQRRQLAVAEAATGGVFWVEGLRIGERFKLDKQTVHRLKWRWTRST